jgi:general secretion pathway protein D
LLAGFVVALVICLALLPEKVRAEDGLYENDQFTINLNNVDIGVLIEQVSSQTGRNFIIDPRVRANVTVVSAEPVDAEGLYKLFLSVLEVHGYAAVTSGSFTKIVPMAVGVQSAVPVLTDRSVNGDELVTDVVPVQHVPVQQLAELLRPLLPSTATIGAEAGSNSIVITDRASNTKRIREIILELDRPQ